jgi:hypothetical protein
MIKILVHRTKHFTAHYNVSTKEMLHKTIRHILNEEKDYYYKPEKPENNTGINCVEDLEKIPFEELRNETAEKWKNYEEQMKRYDYAMHDWNNLQEVLKGKGDPIDAMREYESDCWDIEELQEIV